MNMFSPAATFLAGFLACLVFSQHSRSYNYAEIMSADAYIHIVQLEYSPYIYYIARSIPRLTQVTAPNYHNYNNVVHQ